MLDKEFAELLAQAQTRERLGADLLKAATVIAGRFADVFTPYYRLTVGDAVYRIEVLAWFLENAGDAEHPLVSTRRDRVLLRNGVALHDRRTPDLIDGDTLAHVVGRLYVRYPENAVGFASAKEIMSFLREVPDLLPKANAVLREGNAQMAHEIMQAGAALLNATRGATRTSGSNVRHIKAS